jgi:salicylate hydroxylase
LTLKFHDGQHADLVEILHRLALSAGARVTFGAVVESVEPAPEAPPENSTSTSIAGPSSCTLRPSVRLKTGEILHADVIVGADGPRSVIRRVVTGEAEPEVTSTGLSVYTGNVPMSEIRKHPLLRQLTDGWSVWVGGGRGVLGASNFVRTPHLRVILLPYCILINAEL